MSINLLPWRAEYRRRKKKKLMLLLFSVTAGLMALWISWQCWNLHQIIIQAKTISQLSEEKKQLQTEFKKYQPIVVLHSSRIAAEKTVNNAKNKIRSMINLMDVLAAKLPNELYLTQIEKSGSLVRISGESPSHVEVAMMLKELAGMGGNHAELLKETRQMEGVGSEIMFSINYDLAR